jgi:hypothetical protein
MTALVPLKDETGRERMYASYIKIEPPLKIYARGLAVWDDDGAKFKHLANVDMKAPAFPAGHSFTHGDHVYFAHPFPVTRVRADARSFLDAGAYETYTCLKEGSRLDEPQIDRDEKGVPRYSWRKNAPTVGPQDENKLVKAGKLKSTETRWQLRERGTGKHVVPHAGSVCWNDFRKRWIMIVTQVGGTSFLGEVWYADAETPTGPWRDAVKIVTHEKYSFYNPKQHPAFDKGPYIYFEGTYTHTFSGNSQTTPRYDYNQVMYKLDLADPRLTAPAGK